MYLSSKPMAPAGERTAGKHVPRAKPGFSSGEEEGTLGREVEDLNHSRLDGETAIGVHGHKKITNFQKSSRAICGALGEDCRARATEGAPRGSSVGNHRACRLWNQADQRSNPSPASCCLCDLKQILLCSP